MAERRILITGAASGIGAATARAFAAPGVALMLHTRANREALARVAFVLIGTSHPGNVGAAARAMRTMGVTDLRLVAPRFDDVAERPEARAFASGATGVLDGVRRFATLAEAIGDAALAVAVSRASMSASVSRP